MVRLKIHFNNSEPLREAVTRKNHLFGKIQNGLLLTPPPPLKGWKPLKKIKLYLNQAKVH